MIDDVYDVIMVGAGISGLSAAQQLKSMGVKNVLLLEAQDYVGGRIKTDFNWGQPIELGAEFIHGEHTPTAKLAEELRLDVRESFGHRRLVGRGGEDLTDADTLSYDELTNYIVENGKVGVSVEALAQQRKDIPEDIKNMVLRGIEDLEAGDADTIDSGIFKESLHRTSYLGGNRVLRNGYAEIIEHLSDGLHIKTGVCVRQINDDKIVTILTTNGRKYRAKLAIVTVSLGVLKSDSIKFVPELPVEKKKAIQKLGMGNACKIFVRFRDASVARNIFQLADAENEALMTVTNWWESAANEQVLVGYCGGRRASTLLEIEEDSLKTKIVADLGSIAGRDIQNDVIDFRISRWDTNPYVRGSYSFHPVGSTHQDNELLSKPCGNLLWAGEATQNDGNYAMAHGALSSGFRVAGEALQFLTSKDIVESAHSVLTTG